MSQPTRWWGAKISAKKKFGLVGCRRMSSDVVGCRRMSVWASQLPQSSVKVVKCRESWFEILQGQGQEEDSLSASRQGRIRRELQSLQMADLAAIRRIPGYKVAWSPAGAEIFCHKKLQSERNPTVCHSNPFHAHSLYSLFHGFIWFHIVSLPCSPQALARFQFLEAVVRLAFKRSAISLDLLLHCCYLVTSFAVNLVKWISMDFFTIPLPRFAIVSGERHATLFLISFGPDNEFQSGKPCPFLRRVIYRAGSCGRVLQTPVLRTWRELLMLSRTPTKRWRWSVSTCFNMFQLIANSDSVLSTD